MSDTIPNRSVTQRGFDTYDEFEDRYGSTITVRKSSLAFEDAVWIFCKNGPGFGDVAGEDGSPHLTVEHAQRLINALQTFINESETEDDQASTG